MESSKRAPVAEGQNLAEDRSIAILRCETSADMLDARQHLKVSPLLESCIRPSARASGAVTPAILVSDETGAEYAILVRDELSTGTRESAETLFEEDDP